jgi:predicted site-specific integrase-resolvase
MAKRLGLSTKTLLKHKKAGAIRPTLQRGKLIRWRGDEALNGNGLGNALRK